jgi:hypothetical protein
MISSLFPHLFECIRNIKRTNLLRVLELEKLVSAMASHVNKHIRPIVR